MISDNADHDQFISDHRWGVLTTLRLDGHPVSSVVAYARHEDTVVISTPGGTFKRKSLDRDPRAIFLYPSSSIRQSRCLDGSTRQNSPSCSRNETEDSR